jgi:hypothetical protein
MFDELGSISRDLLADLERARPGFPTDELGFKQAARERVRLRLEDLRKQYASLNADGGFDRVVREIDEVLLRRYVAFALPRTQLEQRGGGAWRSGETV